MLVASLPKHVPYSGTHLRHHVLLTCHRKRCEVKGTIEVRQLDLADLNNVKGFAQQLLATGDNIDLLILNAGVMACPLT
jgi:short-subunit dehydrogenase